MIKGVSLRKVYESGFFSRTRTVAVDGVDIEINAGETLALVGESGCGKSTLGKMMLMQTMPTAGHVFYHGRDLTETGSEGLKAVRTRLQMVPQHPEDTLDPRWEIRRSVAEPLVIQGVLSGDEIRERVETLVATVGLQEEHLSRYPHELSGGELQRAVIARALALSPEVLVCDEPTSMLDVSVQASVLALLKKVQSEQGVAILLITHDLEVAEAVGDRTAVMYAGQVVEEGTGILSSPLHPYTQRMIQTSVVNDMHEQVIEGEGEQASTERCRYYQYCQYRTDACLLRQELIVSRERKVRCALYRST